MMKTFREIFEADYCGYKELTENVLKPVFGEIDKDIYKSLNNELSEIDKEIIQEVGSIGVFTSKNFDEIQCFDVTLCSKVIISKNRVQIQQFIRKILLSNAIGIIVFHYPDNLGDWRISFVSKGEKASDLTSAKRYTYLFGKGRHCRTAAERFEILAKKDKTTQSILDAFSVESLTKDFYNDLFNWYQWALSDNGGFKPITYPNDTSIDTDDRKIDEHIIRLITRLMFVWFIKQKNLIPNDIFSVKALKQILKNFDPESKDNGNYYNAIIQNLFFATLNKAINERDFANDSMKREDGEDHYGIKTLFRNPKGETWFNIPNNEVIDLFSKVPFLNGGLFECLDKEKDATRKIMYFDGFSRETGTQRRAFIPNCLFFDQQKGIIPLLQRYNFTIEENTPSEVEIALDPELLGKVFENLLGAYNPETKETARKQSGSFYTPRDIVNYMVDESLIAHLKNKCPELGEDKIRQLFKLEDNILTFDENTRRKLIYELKTTKILDPACGSGAFPMGVLNRMVDLLQKLNDIEAQTPYDQKLYLIENCIYGIDIQTIAVQISKLRFFISLVCEQIQNDNQNENYGITPLPNLETKFVAANTLIGLKQKDAQGILFVEPKIEIVSKQLQEVRHKHFSARNGNDKSLYRKQDKTLTNELIQLLEQNSLYAPEEAKQLALWNPYDQNTSSAFFDSKWMFDIKEGFDIVIGNPPYVAIQRMDIETKKSLQKYKFKTFENTGDIYAVFYERGQQLLRDGGILSFITSRQWMQASYGKSLRKFLATETNPIQLIDFGQVRLFDTATVFVNILLFEKAKNKNCLTACLIPTDYNIVHGNLTTFFAYNKQKLEKLTENTWAVSNSQHIHDHINKFGKPLCDWTNLEFFRGITSGLNEAFHINNEKKDFLINQNEKNKNVIKPLLRGKDIKRYNYDFENIYMLFIPWHFPLQNDTSITKCSEKAESKFKSEFPELFNHLLNFKTELSNRNKEETGIRYEWYVLQRYGADFWKNFEKPKIVWIEISDRANYAYDENGMYLTNSAYFLTCKDDKVSLKYLLAVLNSTVADFYFSQKTAKIAGGRMRYTKQYVEQIPVPEISLEEQKPFIALVNIILFLKKQILEDSTDRIMSFFFEHVIDVAVAELFFKEQVNKENFEIVKHLQNLPDTSNELMLEKIREIYKEFNNPSHPIRNAVSLLKNYEPLKTIEETLNRKNQ